MKLKDDENLYYEIIGFSRQLDAANEFVNVGNFMSFLARCFSVLIISLFSGFFRLHSEVIAWANFANCNKINDGFRVSLSISLGRYWHCKW